MGNHGHISSPISTPHSNVNELSTMLCLIKYLRDQGIFTPASVVATEVAINQSSRRADLLVIEDKLHAFEIKSESDNVARLTGQIETYHQVCDFVTVVCAPKHLKKVLRVVHVSVGVWVIDKDGEIEVVRSARRHQDKQSISMIRTLNMTELKKVLIGEGIRVAKSKRKDLELRAIELSPSVISKGVYSQLRRRYALPSARFMSVISNQHGVSKSDLGLLSRYDGIPGASRREGRSFKPEEDVHMRVMVQVHGC